MKNPMTMILLTLMAHVALCGGAWAEQAWLCSIGSAVAVDEDGTVGPPDLGERERPTFFRVDAAKKELTLLAPASRRGEVTKIDMVHESQGQRLFSGVENGRSLNLIINDDGRMSLSVLGDGVVWSVFGHALPDGETKAAPKGQAKAETENQARPQSVDVETETPKDSVGAVPSDEDGLSACHWSEGRSHAVVSQGSARCRLVRRK